MCDGVSQNIFGLGPRKAIIRPCLEDDSRDESCLADTLYTLPVVDTLQMLNPIDLWPAEATVASMSPVPPPPCIVDVQASWPELASVQARTTQVRVNHLTPTVATWVEP